MTFRSLLLSQFDQLVVIMLVIAYFVYKVKLCANN